MNNIGMVTKAVEYIENHLSDPIGIDDAAKEVGYSLFHFSRIFNTVLGHSPYDYIMRRRLSIAAKEIVSSKKKITQIALDYQFNSPEAFSRAFKKMFHMSPTQLRKEVSIKCVCFKEAATAEYIQHINSCLRKQVNMVEIEAFSILGSYSKYNDKLDYSILQKEQENDNEEYEAYSVSFYPWCWQREEFNRIMGIKKKTITKTPLNSVGKMIPKGLYAKFFHKDTIETIGMTYDYIFQTWFPKTDFSISEPYTIEYWNDNNQVVILVPLK